jgi:hypothetical protein
VAAIVAVVAVLGNPTIAQIAQAMDLDQRAVSVILTALGAQIKLLAVDQSQVVRFVPSIDCERNCRYISTKLYRLSSELRLSGTDETSGTVQSTEIYQASIVRVLKNHSPMFRDDLAKEVETLCPPSREWKTLDFDSAVGYLEFRTLVRLDPTDRLLIHYIRE